MIDKDSHMDRKSGDEALEADLDQIGKLMRATPVEPLPEALRDSILNKAWDESRRRRRRSWVSSLFRWPFGGSQLTAGGQLTAVASVGAVIAISFGAGAIVMNRLSHDPVDLLAWVETEQTREDESSQTRSLSSENKNALLIQNVQTYVEAKRDHDLNERIVREVERTPLDIIRRRLSDSIYKTFLEMYEILDLEPESDEWKSRVDQLIQSQGPSFSDFESYAKGLDARSDVRQAEKVRDLTAKLEKLFSQRNLNWQKELKED